MIEETEPIKLHPKTNNKSNNFISNLTAGIIAAILMITVSVCCATFIFSGEHLSIYLSTGIGIALISSIIIGGILSLKGSFIATIGSAAIVPAALIGSMAQSITQKITNEGTIQESIQTLLPTILISIIIVTLSTGLVFFLLGRYKLGILVRFIPYPVMGGFLAGVGWLIIQGSVNVMRRVPLNLENQFSHFFNLPTLTHIIPGIMLASILIISQQKYKQFWVMPIIVIAGITAFYVSLLMTNTTIQGAVDMGWLIQPFSNNQVWSSYSFSSFSQANWNSILMHSTSIIAIICVSIISVLLTATGIEAAVDKEIDLDTDLKFTGIGNLLAGTLGGIVGYHSILFTQKNHEAGAKTRFAGLLATLLSAIVALFFASTIVYFFPKPVLGGLLLFFGINLIIEWIYKSWFRLSISDYLLLVAIFITIIRIGFLSGILLGVAFSTILFVIQYSRTSVIKFILSGSTKKSNVERDLKQQKILLEHGDGIKMITLQGYIFFGTSNKLYNLVKDEFSKQKKHPLTYIIFDFQYVNGLDSSAGHSFLKIKKLMAKHNGTLILTAISDEAKKQLTAVGCIDNNKETNCIIYSDLDHGLEWSENKILASKKSDTLEERNINIVLEEWFKNKETADLFLNYLDKKTFSNNQHIFHQGDTADSIYILEYGQASIYLELENNTKLRLKKVTEGAIVGEMGVFRKTTRSASFITDTPTTFYVLSANNLTRMQKENPYLATKFHYFVSCLLSDRLAYANKLMSEL